jgi:hypothetical protein
LLASTPFAEFFQEEKSNQDQREIESLCMELFSGEFGDTLIGVKPITTDDLSYPYEISERCLVSLRKMFEKSPNFVLKIFSRNQEHSIELINRRALRTLVKHNLIVRSFIKREFQNEQDFYSKIEDSHQSIHKVLKNDEKIIGYVLGYSKTNIDYYLRRIEVGRYLQKYPLFCFHPLPGGRFSNCPVVCRNIHLQHAHVKPSNGFKSLEAEWLWLGNISWDLRKETFPTPPHFVSLPFYVCRHGGDSELTREKYKRAECKVAELFYDRSFQEAVAEEAMK